MTLDELKGQLETGGPLPNDQNNPNPNQDDNSDQNTDEEEKIPGSPENTI